MMVEFLNKTLHPVPTTDLEVVILSTWRSISLLLCLIGNGFALYASMRHNAVKLDKMSTHLVHSICVIDICQGLFQLLPKLISAIAGNRWILGKALAVVVIDTKLALFFTNLVLICAMSINKVTRCLYPLRTVGEPSRRRRLVDLLAISVFVIIFLWFFIMTLYPYYVIFYSELLYEPYLTTNSENNFSFVEFIIVSIFFLIPTIILFAANIILVVFAVKNANTSVNKKNIVATVLVALFFLVNAVVIIIWFCYYESLTEVDDVLRTSLSIYLSRLVFILDTITTCINPLIYYTTLKHFRDFCKQFIRSKIRYITSSLLQN
jgi:hypothetical protein